MPTTGEFGPSSGFGDFEEHQELATLAGVHFTHSREDAQGQPSENDFENSQIRLSDGTLLFSADPFGTGGKVQKATYQMLAFNAGMKYKGFDLEGEYYFRWVDHFRRRRDHSGHRALRPWLFAFSVRHADQQGAATLRHLLEDIR